MKQQPMSISSRHLVLFSGGLASFEAGRRVLNKYGKEAVEFLFFDTLMEDDDLYRFLSDCEDFLDVNIVRFADGRNPWEVFHDKRFIGNSRVDVCSRLLKRELLERLLKERYQTKDVVIYFGLEWSENHRIEVVRASWKLRGYQVKFPLLWEPILFPCDFKQIFDNIPIEIPRLYKLGFPHNNCGGACVKAGIKQWSLLWKTFPRRFKWHEQQEQSIRKYLVKNVSILRNRRGGVTRPMTLRYLRWRLQQIENREGSIDSYLDRLPDNWSCSCFVGVMTGNQDFG